MQTGFSVPLDELVKFSLYAKRLLKPQGVLLFVKADGAITLTKDDPGGGLTFNVYDSPFGIFARHPMLADYVCATVSGIDRRRLRGGGISRRNFRADGIRNPLYRLALITRTARSPLAENSIRFPSRLP